MRILSFNIRGAWSWDGRDSWPFRRGRVAAVLAAQRPDVAAFQEVLWPASGFLAARLPEHTLARGVPTGNRLVRGRNPVFSALEVLASGGFWLSPTPGRWSSGWGARQVRGATWARLADSGRTFLLVNAHLDHVSAAARAGGVEVILERLRGLGWPEIPAVVCGDFNCNPGDPPHRALLGAGLRDSFVETGGSDGEDTVTFHGFRGRPTGTDRRIDWIFSSPPLRARAAAIVTGQAPYPSDHHPVVAELEWDQGVDGGSRARSAG